MTYRIEIEERGRITLPRELLKALNLVPGSAVELQYEEDEPRVSLYVAPTPPTEPYLVWVDGLPSIQGLPPETAEETVAAIREMREERLEHLAV